MQRRQRAWPHRMREHGVENVGRTTAISKWKHGYLHERRCRSATFANLGGARRTRRRHV
jgi:hypothetical protein